MSIRIGYIPEHFSTPLQFALSNGYFKESGLNIQLVPFPSGSGHLITSLNQDEIDIAIGLTEAFVRGVADTEHESELKYEILGTYVSSPLNWAVSTGINRDDITNLQQLEGAKMGVSRIGSGSYVMSYVLALQLKFSQEPPYSDWPICHTFKQLRDAVRDKTCDAFMWEYFTTKKYYEEPKELKMIGNIYTPWPSWVIVRNKNLSDEQTKQFVNGLQRGIQYFETHQEEAIRYIYENLDYNEADAREWIKTVQFAIRDPHEAIQQTISVLRTAGAGGVSRDPAVVERNLRAGQNAHFCPAAPDQMK